MALITIDPGQNVDIKKVTGIICMVALLGVAGWAFTVYLLPFLLAMIWGTIELAVGVAVGSILLFWLSRPQTWRGFRYLGEFAAQAFLGWLINMNPFGVLEYRIEKTEEDTKKLLDYNKKLKGKSSELQDKIADRDDQLKVAIQKERKLEEILKSGKGSSNDKANLEVVVNQINNAKKYIDGIQPTFKDLQRLCDFTDRAYQAANIKILKAKDDLSTQRDLYETVTTASATMSKAWKALMGDKNLNNDADKAIEFLKQDIGAKIGDIRENIKITGQYMDGADLEDAARLSSTLKQLEGVDLSVNTYSSTLNPVASKMNMDNNGTAGNKYLDILDN